MAKKEKINEDSSEDSSGGLKEKQKKLLIEELALYQRQMDNKIYFLSEEFYNRRGFISIRPNPFQERMLREWSNPHRRTVIGTGGNRLGKTAVQVWVLIASMIGYWPWDRSKTPVFPREQPVVARWIGQNWDTHIKTVLVPTFREWWPKARKLRESKHRSTGVTNYFEDAETGGNVTILSDGADAVTAEGWKGHIVAFDEPPSQEMWLANVRGLVDHGGRALFAMTHNTQAWVSHRLLKARTPDGLPDTTVAHIVGHSYENAGFGITRENLDQFAGKLTEAERRVRISGESFTVEGAVLPEYRRDVHIKQRFVVPSDWVVDIAIDIHPSKKQAVLFVATSPHNFKYVVDEIWEHGDGHAIGDRIVKRVHERAYRVNRVIVDPLAKSDSNAPATTYDKLAKVLGTYGLSIETASKKKEDGILEIRAGLYGPNREPSLFFFHDLARTLYEIDLWSNDPDTGKPRKADDDMMENLYRLMLLGTEYIAEEENLPRCLRAPAGEQPWGCQGVNPITGY